MLRCITLDDETDLSVSRVIKLTERGGIVPFSIYDLDTLTITKTMCSAKEFKKKFVNIGIFDYKITTPVRVGAAIDLDIVLGYDTLSLKGKSTLWDMDFDKLYAQYKVYLLRDEYKVGGVRWVQYKDGVVIVRFEVMHRYKHLDMEGMYLVDMHYSYDSAILEKVLVNNTQIFDQNTDMKKGFVRYKLSGEPIGIKNIADVYRIAKGS